MDSASNTVQIVNTLLCAAILITGYWGFRNSGKAISLLIGLAFGIFGLTHVISLLGFRAKATGFVIVARILAYLIVLVAIYAVASKSGKKEA